MVIERVNGHHLKIFLNVHVVNCIVGAYRQQKYVNLLFNFCFSTVLYGKFSCVDPQEQVPSFGFYHLSVDDT